MRADRLAEAIRNNASAWYEGRRTWEAFGRFASQLWDIAARYRIADDVAQIVAPRMAR